MGNGMYALFGALIGAAFGVGGTWLTQRFAEKRHRRELSYRAGLDVWQVHQEWAWRSGSDAMVPPPEDYVLAALAFFDLVVPTGKIDFKNLEERMRKGEAMTKEIFAARQRAQQIHAS